MTKNICTLCGHDHSDQIPGRYPRCRRQSYPLLGQSHQQPDAAQAATGYATGARPRWQEPQGSAGTGTVETERAKGGVIMANMAYARFRNTLDALADCQEHMEDELSPEEEKARIILLRVCQEIVQDNFDLLDEDYE